MENNAFHQIPLIVFCIAVSSGIAAPAAGSPVQLSPVSGQSAESVSSQAPRVGSERLQERVDEAWRKAAAGENPAMTCAGVKGRAVAFPKNLSAQRAAYVCGVDIPVRYFQTFLDQVEAGEKSCSDFMMAMTIELGALTISTDTIRNMAESMPAEGRDDEAQAAATEALDSAIREAAFEQGPGDTQRIVKNRLADRIRRVCPDYADYILR